MGSRWNAREQSSRPVGLAFHLSISRGKYYLADFLRFLDHFMTRIVLSIDDSLRAKLDRLFIFPSSFKGSSPSFK